MDPSGSKDYSLKQSLLSRNFEEWLLRATLRSDSSTRNQIVESLRQIRSGGPLTIEKISGPLWRVQWAHRDTQVLELLLATSRDFLQQSGSRLARPPEPTPDDGDLQGYERKLAQNLLLDGAGSTNIEQDYTDPVDYQKAVRERRGQLWQAHQRTLAQDFRLPLVRVIESEPISKRLTPGWWLCLALFWCGGLAYPWLSRGRLSS